MLRKFLVAAVVVVLAYYAYKVFYEKNPGAIVATSNGRVQGIVSRSRKGRAFTEWLGIPYAKSPVGELRFESPQPIDRWDGIRDGSQPGAKCPQIEVHTRSIGGNEDCLFLNVHSPADLNDAEKKKLLPVMIFIHGGYFENGNGDMYRPTYFMDEEVVLVTINYRLNVFGFLSTGDGTIRGNMGLKDQALAIRWVKYNIDKFGGDPNQITVFGESAGSVSVHMQLLSPLSKGLIKRAISFSGSAFGHWAVYEKPAEQAKNYAKRVKCDDLSTAQVAKCLRGLSVEELINGLRHHMTPERRKEDVFVPVVEAVDDVDAFLAQTPEVLYKTGNVSKVPWLTGVNSVEGILHAGNFIRYPSFTENVRKNWNIFEETILYSDAKLKAHSESIRQFYFGKLKDIDVMGQLQQFAHLSTDRNYFSVIIKTVEAHGAHAPVYPYFYSKEGMSFMDLLIHMRGRFPGVLDTVYAVLRMFWDRWTGKPRILKGACHADELSMLFEIPPVFTVPVGSEYFTFSEDFVSSLVQFAAGKHPEFRGQPFPSFSKGKQVKFLEFTDKPKVIDFPHSERLAFWNKMLAS